MVELIVSGIASLIGGMFDNAVKLLAPLLGFSFKQFNDTFPFALTAYSLFRTISLGIVLLIAAVQIIPFLTQSQSNRSNPVRIGAYVIVAVAFIYYGNYLLEGLMRIAQQPYNALSAANANAYAGISFSPVTAAITDLCYSTSVLLSIFLLVLIGIAFLKLLLECVERYVILMSLIYLSPLAFSTLASDETRGICKRFIGMFISQCILMVLSIWSLKMVVSVFINLHSNDGKAMALVMCYAFLRVAQRLDSYLNQLGLNAAITGAGLGSELMGAGMLMASRLGGMFGKQKSFSGDPKAGGSAGGGTGAVLGLGQKMASTVGKYSPVAGAGDMLKNSAGAAAHSVSRGMAVGKDGFNHAQGSLINRVKAGFSQGASATKEQMGSDMSDAWKSTQDTNVWARAADSSFSHEAAAAAQTMSGGESLTQEQRADIANYPYMASKAFNAFSDESMVANDPADVSAVMRGTGIERIDSSASGAINAGLGVTEGQNMAYSLDSTGLKAQFTRDGVTESWNVKNASQYGALSKEQQSAYTHYKDKSGNSYYYQKSSSRAPTELQQRQASHAAEVKSFVSNPGKNHISADAFATMQRKPEFTKEVFTGFKTHGTSMTYSTENRMDFAGIVESSKIDGIKQADKQSLIMQMRSEEIISATANGNGMQAEWESGGNYHRFTMLTEDGMTMNEMDESNLAAKGYVHNNSSGMDFWALHEQMPTEMSRDPVTRDLNRERI